MNFQDAEHLRAERFGQHGEFLRDSQRLEIYSVDSIDPSINPEEPRNEQEFHGFRIYGMTQTDNKEDIAAIWSELHERIYAEPGSSVTYCFLPRHAIRAFHGDSYRDYLICFECNHLYVYDDRDSKNHERIGLERVSGALKLNELLDKANIHREQTETTSEQVDMIDRAR